MLEKKQKHTGSLIMSNMYRNADVMTWEEYLEIIAESFIRKMRSKE